MPRLLPAGIAWATLFATTLIMPAFAHPGAHDGLGLGGLVQHLGTAWHIWPLVAAAAVGLAVWVIGQSRQASKTVASSRAKERS